MEDTATSDARQKRKSDETNFGSALPLRKRIHAQHLAAQSQLISNENSNGEKEPTQNTVVEKTPPKEPQKEEDTSLVDVVGLSDEEGDSSAAQRDTIPQQEKVLRLPPRKAMFAPDEKGKEVQQQSPPKIEQKQVVAAEPEAEEEDDETLYCICRRPDIPGVMMIACDLCDEWFHAECVGISPEDAEDIEEYVCVYCRKKSSGKRKPSQQQQQQQQKKSQTSKQSTNTSRNTGRSTTSNTALVTNRVEPVVAPKVSTVSPPPSSPASPVSPSLGGKKCLHRDCSNFAKPNSKYCSDECGVKVMKEKVDMEAKQALKQQLQQDAALSAVSAEDLKAIDALHKRQQEVKDSLVEIDQREAMYQKAIEFAATLVAPASYEDQSGENGMDKEEERSRQGSGLEIIDCVTCGQPIPAKTYSRHLEMCFVKKEGQSSRALNGVLRDNLLCGYPSPDFPNGYCDRLKKNCVKHVNWESLRLSHCAQDRLRQNKLLDSLLAEEKVLWARIERRNSMQSQANRTIVETQ